MAEATGIEWCDSTFNPWIGCTRVSPACDDCYAARSTPARTLSVTWGAHEARRRTSDANWRLPTRWNAKRFMQCEDCGWRGEASAPVIGCGRCGSIELSDTRRRVFCASLADVFDREVPPMWRSNLFELIRTTPNLDWLLLTKRPQNIVRMVRSDGAIAGTGTRYLPDNVSLGTTAEDQKRADINVPALLRCRAELGARVLFVSVEPMLGPVDLTRIVLHTGPIDLAPDAPPEWRGVRSVSVVMDVLRAGKKSGNRIDWVICGGESGAKARPMHPDWARGLRDQCAAAGVPFLFKQWGEWRHRPLVEDTRQDRADSLHYVPEHDATYARVGKKAAGRLLDAVTHDGFPCIKSGLDR
jgi:protein gp37